MRRDLDLIRLMLLASEQSEGAIGCPAPSECCGDIGRLAFHDELMQSKGQVVACIMRDAFRRITSRDGTAPKSRAARPPGVRHHQGGSPMETLAAFLALATGAIELATALVALVRETRKRPASNDAER